MRDGMVLPYAGRNLSGFEPERAPNSERMRRELDATLRSYAQYEYKSLRVLPGGAVCRGVRGAPNKQ